MSSYLAVAFFGRCAFLEVESFEDGVFPETVLDIDNGFLHTAFFFKLLLLLLLLLLLFFVVGEEVELVVGMMCGLDGVVFFGCDVECGDGYSPDEE